MNKPTNIKKTEKIGIACLKRCKSIFLVLCTTLLLTINCQLSLAQSFPVQIIPQAVPPPPIYFSDYANAGTVNSPLRVQIVLNDLNITNREIRLRTSFEGNGIAFQSNDIVSGAGPLFLEGGVPLVLTNAELAPYFQFQNITGISPDVYGQAIPEGLYQFCFEVFDVLTGNRLSQRSCVGTVVFQNEPPFLISPYNKSNIEERNPQNIVFQWTPRHINVSNVEYELSIVEIWDNVVDPQAVFLSSPPVFQVTTTATTYVYGPADPLFLSNKSYAWRVQAKAIQGIEEIGLFKNQGFSEIFSFSYAKTCDIPKSVSHEVKGSHQANISWEDFTTEVPEFTVRYREKGDTSNEWFLSKTTANWVTIWDLKPGTTYEYQVNKKCVITESEWSLEKEFTTALEIEESDLYECGISPNINVTNQDPLPNISSGEKFKAGDFPVTVGEVNGSNGRFTGKGHVSLPYLENIKIAVEFTNILINEEKELAEGTVITVYDPEWKNILDTGDVADVLDDLGDVFTGGDNVDIPLDYEITKDDIKIEDGEIVITKPDGTTETFDYDEGDTYQITDASGNTFAIDENGNITQEAEGAEGGAATSQNTDGIVSGGNGNVGNPSVGNITANGVLVVFKKGNAKYDFDEADNDFEKTRYPKAKLPNGEDYYPVHKAVVDGKTDEFLAEVTITNPDIVLDSLIFKTVKGAKITTRKIDDKNIAITIKGSNSYRSEEAIITYKDKDGKYKITASFFIHHIKEQELVNVVMVSVNGAAHIPGLESELNKIYEKAGAKFKIVKEDALQLSVSDWDTKTANGLLDYDGSGLLSDYPQELKNIHQKYKRDNTNYDPKAYHLFLLPDDIKLTKPLSGFMPKTRQWGYVFNAHKNGEAIESKSSQELVVAHELGHGVFTLAHPFQNDDSPGSGTNWLMDYGVGDQLPYAHWAAMGDESLQLYLFQDEEDSEIANKIWFTPDWKPFKVDNTSTILGFDLGANFKGAIPGFRNSFGIDYKAEIKNGEFTGKYIDVNGVSATLSYQTVDNGDEVYFYEYNGCGKSKRLKYAYNNSYTDFSDYLSKGKVLSTKVYPCSELCDKGKKFFDQYLYLVKNDNQTEIDALNSIAQLICAEGEEAIDYDILVAQISKDEDQKRNNFWNGHDRYLFDIARELFWERENAFALYLEALVRVNKNINAYNTRLGSDFTKEDYYASLYYLNDRFLESLKPEDKVSILDNIFNKDAFITSGMFGITNDDESLIMKVVNSVNENKSEAKVFLDSLAVTKDLFDDLNSGLDDHLGAKNFTDFILKIARLAKLAYGSVDDSQIAPKYTFTWGIKNVDFVLSWVSTLGDYKFNYEDNQVLLTGQCSSSFVDDGAGGVGTDEECLIDNVPLNPFQDFVQITIIESANLLPELCNNQEAQFCGKGIIVPAIFLEYLNTKKENQQLENLGFNVITIAGIILTGGELAAAKVGSAVWIWAASDLAYTFSDPIAQHFKEDVAQRFSPEMADYIYTAWDGIGLIFQIKGAVDLSGINKPDVIKGIAAKEVLGENDFYQSLENGIRKNKPDISDTELVELVDETKSGMNQLKSEISPDELNAEIENARKLLGDLADVEDWITVLGKNIYDLTVPPKGYQFYMRNGKKWIRRKSADNPNTPRLTVRDGKIVKYFHDGQVAYKAGWSKSKVLSYPKASRPSPETYLEASYIMTHMTKFNEGASYLVPKKALDTYGRNPVGRPDGQFVMSKKEMDNLLNEADGDLSIVETELGIPQGSWANEELVRIDILSPTMHNGRIPKGTENGANELWIPGGILPNGYSEIVIDAVPSGSFTETLTNLK